MHDMASSYFFLFNYLAPLWAQSNIISEINCHAGYRKVFGQVYLIEKLYYPLSGVDEGD